MHVCSSPFSVNSIKNQYEKIEREIMSSTLIDTQWNLSTADTIGTTYVCPEYGGVCTSGASGYISGRHGNAHSGFLAQYGHVSAALACCVLVRRLLKPC